MEPQVAEQRVLGLQKTAIQQRDDAKVTSSVGSAAGQRRLWNQR
jgi:hypothetical protein